MNIAMSLNCIFNGHSAATSTGEILLETFLPAGAQGVVLLFAALGLEHFVIRLLCISVLLRYPFPLSGSEHHPHTS
jgi:hypothetical protein